MPGAAGGVGAGANAGVGAQANPFAAFGGMGGMGGMDPFLMQQMLGGGMGAPVSAPTDTRPPREKYASQLQ